MESFCHQSWETSVIRGECRLAPRTAKHASSWSNGNGPWQRIMRSMCRDGFGDRMTSAQKSQVAMSSNPDPQEDPKSRSPKDGLQYSYGVDYRTLRWIFVCPGVFGLPRVPGASIVVNLMVPYAKYQLKIVHIHVYVFI